MTTETEPTTWQTILSDHVDARPVTGDLDQAILGRNDIVQLDPDHPGFRDAEYRARRNQIAQLALNYHPGDPIPDAPYTTEEHQVWSVIWRALRPAHQKFACAEYLEALNRLSFSDDRIPQLREVNERSKPSAAFVLNQLPAWFSRACSWKTWRTEYSSAR